MCVIMQCSKIKISEHQMGTVAIGFSLAGTFMYIHVYSTRQNWKPSQRKSAFSGTMAR